jgi:hypothetical protein
LFMNYKIWIFKIDKPNNKKEVKVLTYIWQIEAEKYKIKWFVTIEKEILIVNDSWVYRLMYSVSMDDDWKYTLKIDN